MSIYQKEVLNPIRDALDGNIKQIPLHLERVKEVFSIRKSIYTGIIGGTG